MNERPIPMFLYVEIWVKFSAGVLSAADLVVA